MELGVVVRGGRGQEDKDKERKLVDDDIVVSAGRVR